MLCLKLLEELRAHLAAQRLRKKSMRLFSGKTTRHACEQATRRASIKKSLSPRASPLLRNPPAGSQALLHTIQILLGHHTLMETAFDLNLSQRHLHATASPLDALALKSLSKPSITQYSIREQS